MAPSGCTDEPKTATPKGDALLTAKLARASSVKLMELEAKRKEAMEAVREKIVRECPAMSLANQRDLQMLKAQHDKKVQMLTALVENLSAQLEVAQGKLEALELNLAEFIMTMKTVAEQMPQSVASTPTTAAPQHLQPQKSEVVKDSAGSSRIPLGPPPQGCVSSLTQSPPNNNGTAEKKPRRGCRGGQAGKGTRVERQQAMVMQHNVY